MDVYVCLPEKAVNWKVRTILIHLWVLHMEGVSYLCHIMLKGLIRLILAYYSAYAP